jgi:hypothetical protein
MPGVKVHLAKVDDQIYVTVSGIGDSNSLIAVE